MNATNETKCTCQICGRPIKTKNGLIAHHGYKRPGDGFQTSSCLGARFAPYEISSERIPVVIEQLEQTVTRMGELLADLEKNPPASFWIYVRFGGSGRIENREVFRPENFNVNWETGSMPNSYGNAFVNRRYELRRTEKAAREQLAYLRTRLADWKPANG